MFQTRRHHGGPPARQPARRRRAGRIVVAVAVMAAVVASASPAGAAPGGEEMGSVSLSTARLSRGSTVTVSAPGCDDAFQFVEARLVVGHGANRRSAAIASGRGPVSLEVPGWVPSGRAAVEASCTEADLSAASDGADLLRFDYRPVPVTVAPGPVRRRSGRVRLKRVVADGTLHVSGSGCSGTVMVSVARGGDLIGSSTRFHYGTTLVEAGPDGRWQVDVALRYSVAALASPIAPGRMGLFASCDGRSYRPERFTISHRSPHPPVQPQGDPAQVYLGQCSSANITIVVARVTLADGSMRTVSYAAPGVEYGEVFLTLPLPSGVVAASYSAACVGRSAPSFTYAPATWPVP